MSTPSSIFYRVARECSIHLAQLGLLYLFVALTACGGGGAPTESALPSANAVTDQSQVNAADLSPTNAQSLPSPTLPDTPMLANAPSAPISGQQSRELLSLPSNVLASARKIASLPTPTLLRRKVVGGLIEPTDLVTASDGTLFFTERGRGLFVLRPGADAVSVFSEREVAPTSRSGMFAVALDPEFTRNRFVYVLARTSWRGAEVGRVIRVALDATYTRATNRIDILKVPISAALDPGQQRLSVSKGDLRFGPDGYLYVSLGDDSQSTASQATQTLAGEFLRIEWD